MVAGGVVASIAFVVSAGVQMKVNVSQFFFILFLSEVDRGLSENA
jgi:hypothetical protein